MALWGLDSANDNIHAGGLTIDQEPTFAILRQDNITVQEITETDPQVQYTPDTIVEITSVTIAAIAAASGDPYFTPYFS